MYPKKFFESTLLIGQINPNTASLSTELEL
jgi:hypothetical protein